MVLYGQRQHLIDEFPGGYFIRLYACQGTHQSHVVSSESILLRRYTGQLDSGVPCTRCGDLVFPDRKRRGSYTRVFVILEEP